MTEDDFPVKLVDGAPVSVFGKVAVNGPCRLTVEERRLGETKGFTKKRQKNRQRNKLAKASRKNR